MNQLNIPILSFGLILAAVAPAAAHPEVQLPLSPDVLLILSHPRAGENMSMIREHDVDLVLARVYREEPPPSIAVHRFEFFRRSELGNASAKAAAFFRAAIDTHTGVSSTSRVLWVDSPVITRTGAAPKASASLARKVSMAFPTLPDGVFEKTRDDALARYATLHPPTGGFVPSVVGWVWMNQQGEVAVTCDLVNLKSHLPGELAGLPVTFVYDARTGNFLRSHPGRP
jgi:hypothetical protein